MKHIPEKCFNSADTFSGVLGSLLHDPHRHLMSRWNWKSAVLSSLCRAIVFLLVNLSAGLNAATGAMIAEFLYRVLTAGYSGALTQAFRHARPRWAAAATIPAVSHLLEFLLHWLRGTPNLRLSIAASLVFTVFSTLFNLHAMSRGVLTVGLGSKSLADDFRSLPLVFMTFLRSRLGLCPECHE